MDLSSNDPYVELEPLRAAHANNDSGIDGNGTPVIVLLNNNGDNDLDGGQRIINSGDAMCAPTGFGLPTERQARKLVLGRWVWCTAFCVWIIFLGFFYGSSYFYDYDHVLSSLFLYCSGDAIQLLLLHCNKRARGNKKPLMATDLIPPLIFSFLFSILVGDAYSRAVVSFLVLLLTTIATNSSRCQRENCAFRNTNGIGVNDGDCGAPRWFFKPRVKLVLVLGQWIWPLLAAFSVEEIFYYAMEYETLLAIGNGIGLILLWCHKQGRTDFTEVHQKQLFASELIPTILFTLFPDDLMLLPVCVLLFVTIRACTPACLRTGFRSANFLHHVIKELTGTNFKEMEEQHFEALRDSAEEEQRELQAQLDRLAYLEDDRGPRSSHAKRVTRTQQIVIGLAIFAIVRALFSSVSVSSIDTVSSIYVKSDTVKFR